MRKGRDVQVVTVKYDMRLEYFQRIRWRDKEQLALLQVWARSRPGRFA